jgi:hypothetical protein
MNEGPGMPYVTRDGRANPEARLYDRRRFNLLTDPMSIEHGQAANNHGSYHDYLLAYLMLFLGRPHE